METYVALSGREDEDLEMFRAYYAEKRGVRPHLQGDIRFTRSPLRAADGG